MAEIQISGLPEQITDIANSDIFHIKEGTTDKKMTKANVKKAFANPYTYTVTGSPNALTLTAEGNTESPFSYEDGFAATFTATNTNTGATQINVDTIGLVDLKDSTGAPLIGGEIVTGERYGAYYVSGDPGFRLVPLLSKGTVQALTEGGFIDLLARGAVGDGVADDSAIMNSAISESSTTGKKIHLPWGYDFYVPSISMASNSHFFGGGTLTTESGLVVNNLSNIKFEDVHFVRNNSDASNQNATVYVHNGGSNVQFLNCRVTGPEGGFFLNSEANSDNTTEILISECTIITGEWGIKGRSSYTLTGGSGNPYLPFDCRCKIINNYIEVTNNGGTNQGIEYWAPGCLISGNWVEQSFGAPNYAGTGFGGITIGTHDRVIVTNNYIIGWGYGIEIGNTAFSPNVRGNWIEGCIRGIFNSSSGKEGVIQLHDNVVVMNDELRTDYVGAYQFKARHVQLFNCRAYHIISKNENRRLFYDVSDSNTRKYTGIYCDTLIDSLQVVGGFYAGFSIGVRALLEANVDIQGTTFYNCLYANDDSGGNPRVTYKNCYLRYTGGSNVNKYLEHDSTTFDNSTEPYSDGQTITTNGTDTGTLSAASPQLTTDEYILINGAGPYKIKEIIGTTISFWTVVPAVAAGQTIAYPVFPYEDKAYAQFRQVSSEPVAISRLYGGCKFIAVLDTATTFDSADYVGNNATGYSRAALEYREDLDGEVRVWSGQDPQTFLDNIYEQGEVVHANKLYVPRVNVVADRDFEIVWMRYDAYEGLQPLVMRAKRPATLGTTNPAGSFDTGSQYWYKDPVDLGSPGLTYIVGGTDPAGSGSSGQYVGAVTATATGTNVITLSATEAEFTVGRWLEFGVSGANGRGRIVEVDGTTVTLNTSAVISAGAGLAIDYSLPTINDMAAGT